MPSGETNSVSFFKSCQLLDALIGMRDQHLRVLLEHGGDLDGRHVLLDGVETLQRVGAQKKSILPTSSSMRLLAFGPPWDDGDIEAVFAVGAVGERLIEAAMLGFRHPVGAEGDFVERLRRGRAGMTAAATAHSRYKAAALQVLVRAA